MKNILIVLSLILSGCMSAPQSQNQSKNCGFRIGMSQYSSTGVYFDYNCNTYQSY